jgi:hypothetical protein
MVEELDEQQDPAHNPAATGAGSTNRVGLGVGLRSWLHGNIELAGTEQRRHPAVAEHWPRSDTATAVT